MSGKLWELVYYGGVYQQKGKEGFGEKNNFFSDGTRVILEISILRSTHKQPKTHGNAHDYGPRTILSRSLVFFRVPDHCFFFSGPNNCLILGAGDRPTPRPKTFLRACVQRHHRIHCFRNRRVFVNSISSVFKRFSSSVCAFSIFGISSSVLGEYQKSALRSRRESRIQCVRLVQSFSCAA